MADAISTSTEDSQDLKSRNDFQIPEKLKTPLKIFGGLFVLVLIGLLIWIELSDRSTYLGHHTFEDGCVRRYFGEDSFACVCNATYCDTVRPVGHLERNEAIIYETSAEESRLRRLYHRFKTDQSEHDHVIRVDLLHPKHTIMGFGGTLSDSAFVNIVKYQNLTKEILHQYFGSQGLRYNILRVPIGATEFSSECYTLDDKSYDYGLQMFSLDNDHKLPFIKDILELNKDIKLLAVAHTAPGWMKDTHKIIGPAELRMIGRAVEIYYTLYAEYLIRYLEDAHKLGLKFWGISPLNEPLTGLTTNDTSSPRLSMAPEHQRAFINDEFGPALKGNSGTKDVNIVFHEDTKESLLGNINTLFQDGDGFVDGFAVHTYFTNNNKSINNLVQTHNFLPNKFILTTQAIHRDRVAQGSWKYAADYASDIITSLNNYVNGYVDYNLALNEQGGPSLNWQTAAASIIVNSKGATEFYKQPTFYVLGHFSHFIPAGSKVLPIQIGTPEGQTKFPEGPIECLAVQTPEYNVVLILHNKDTEKTHRLTIDASTEKTSRFLSLELVPSSIRTVIWRLEAE
ncbi:unnamed protein product [Bursaphelenchus okinawaensis]|uniref:Glucosylceramidase n=1 Tax=Bursaphelenchus okinawaensis TaxID=465554 RepID=A0A811L3S7_9BILA|nr:unnamed protein product [Bursaphelenchus okinawaensis]CAG9118756.1 unnamed protein product [Bursaphelenchus okinawaensis]